MEISGEEFFRGLEQRPVPASEPWTASGSGARAATVSVSPWLLARRLVLIPVLMASGCQTVEVRPGEGRGGVAIVWEALDRESSELAASAVSLDLSEDRREESLCCLDEKAAWASARAVCNVAAQILTNASYSYSERLAALNMQAMRTPFGVDVLSVIQREGLLVDSGTHYRRPNGEPLFDASTSRYQIHQCLTLTLVEASYAAGLYRESMETVGSFAGRNMGQEGHRLAMALFGIMASRRPEFYLFDTDAGPVRMNFDSLHLTMFGHLFVIPSRGSTRALEDGIGPSMDVCSLQRTNPIGPNYRPRLVFRLTQQEWKLLRPLFAELGASEKKPPG